MRWCSWAAAGKRFPAGSNSMRWFLEWVVTGVGGDWTVDALQATGRLFRIPPAMQEPA